MANVLRIKLHALYGPRLLSSPALAPKIFDPTCNFLKCYGGSALLEDSCGSTLQNGIDGDSKDANGGGAAASKGDDVDEKASNLKECNVDKITKSICDKLWAKTNVARGGKDSGVQRDSVLTQESKQANKDDPFQKVVSTIRSMVLKDKAKAAAGDKSSELKLEEYLDKESDSCEGSNGSSALSQLVDMNEKSHKQLRSQLVFPKQQKSKDTKNAFSLLNSLDDATSLTSPMSTDEDPFATPVETSKSKTALPFTESDISPDNLILKSKEPRQSEDAMPGSAMHGSVKPKLPKGKDTASPLAAQDGSRAQFRNQAIGNNTPPAVMFSFKAKRSDDAPFTQLYGKTSPLAKEAASPPHSRQNNSIPRTGHMVCVQNLPSSCNPAAIKSAMANHGEVLGLFKKAIGNDFFDVYVEFKTEQSMEAAIASRKLQIGSKSFVILKKDKVMSTVVRVCKVSSGTSEKQLLSMCGKFGSIDDIRKRVNGIFDVFYEVKELPNMTRILASLNEVTYNRSTWVATQAPFVHPLAQNDLLKSQEGQAWHSTQINQALFRIETGIDGLAVFLEDLKELNALGKEFSNS